VKIAESGWLSSVSKEHFDFMSAGTRVSNGGASTLATPFGDCRYHESAVVKNATALSVAFTRVASARSVCATRSEGGTSHTEPLIGSSGA
jgi:hypothetical protein